MPPVVFIVSPANPDPVPEGCSVDFRLGIDHPSRRNCAAGQMVAGTRFDSFHFLSLSPRVLTPIPNAEAER